MNVYEIIAIVGAALAIIISISALASVGTIRKEARQIQMTTADLSKKQQEIQMTTADLSKKQQDMITRAEETRNKARLALSIIKDVETYRFRIDNVSNAEARNVDIKFQLDNPNDNPIVLEDYQGKFPVPVLTPKGSITLLAKLNLDKPSPYNALLSWSNPDGSRVEEKMAVSM